MNRGLFLIDGAKNTLFIPQEDLQYSDTIKKLTPYIKQHKTLKELDADVRLYLKGEYYNNEAMDR